MPVSPVRRRLRPSSPRRSWTGRSRPAAPALAAPADEPVCRRFCSHVAYPPGRRSTSCASSMTTTSATVRSRNARSWLTTTSAPGQSSRKSSRARSESRSRSFVGSSSSSTFGRFASVRSSWSRRRSPPDSVPMGAHCASPSNQNRSSSDESDQSALRAGPADGVADPHRPGRGRRRAGPRPRARPWSPTTTRPSAGAMRPPMTWSSVVLPAPLGPTTPSRSRGSSRRSTPRNSQGASGPNWWPTPCSSMT